MTPKSMKKRLILTPKICKKRPAFRLVFQRFWVGKPEAQYQKHVCSKTLCKKTYYPAIRDIIQYTPKQYNIIRHNTIRQYMQYNIIQYKTTQYNTIQYHTLQYDTLDYTAMQCKAMQCNVMECNALLQYYMQYSPIQYNIIQDSAIQYNIIPHITLQCNAMQHNAMQCNALHPGVPPGKTMTPKSTKQRYFLCQKCEQKGQHFVFFYSHTT